MKLKQFLLPILTGLVVSASLYLTIIVKSGTEFEIFLLLAYLGIGLLSFAYGLLLRKLRMPIGVVLYFILTTLSGIYFFFSMPKGSDGLSELAVFLGWIVLMIGSLVVTIITGIIERVVRSRKSK